MKRYACTLATMLLASSIIIAGEIPSQITTFPAEGISSVKIDVDSGQISVEGASTNTITVEQLRDNSKLCNVSVSLLHRLEF